MTPSVICEYVTACSDVPASVPADEREPALHLEAVHGLGAALALGRLQGGVVEQDVQWVASGLVVLYELANLPEKQRWHSSHAVSHSRQIRGSCSMIKVIKAYLKSLRSPCMYSTFALGLAVFFISDTA